MKYDKCRSCDHRVEFGKCHLDDDCEALGFYQGQEEIEKIDILEAKIDDLNRKIEWVANTEPCKECNGGKDRHSYYKCHRCDDTGRSRI